MLSQKENRGEAGVAAVRARNLFHREGIFPKMIPSMRAGLCARIVWSFRQPSQVRPGV